jgi:hypothetical protein
MNKKMAQEIALMKGGTENGRHLQTGQPPERKENIL